MRVGGALQMGLRVGMRVGVLISVGVAVGNAVSVGVKVEMDGILVEFSITGIGATGARCVQALLNKNRMRKRGVMRFMGFPPDDEMNCFFNGSVY